MARPSEIDSKTISVRIPMVKYMELLEEAIEKRLSVSELITYYLFSKKTQHKTSNELKNEIIELTPAEPKRKLIMEGYKYDVYNFFTGNDENGTPIKGFRIKIEALRKGEEVKIGKYLVKYPKLGKLKVFA